MPSDVSVEMSAQVLEAPARRRLPIGFGLSIGACASVALWTCIALGFRALIA